MASKQDMQNMQGKQQLTKKVTKYILDIEYEPLGIMVSAILKADLREADEYQNDTYFWAFSSDEINDIEDAKSSSRLNDEEMAALDTLVAAIREVDDVVELTWSF